jgi:putative SOS response-associated peptidase YedK
MCGRFALQSIPKPVLDEFVIIPPPVKPRYNIAPTQPVPVVLAGHDGKPVMAELRWGLIPPWAKDISVGVRAINARAETVAEKPAFRDAFGKRRCLVPASGFYEWKREGKTRTPYYFTSRNGPIVFAGLWERWDGGEIIRSFAIITTEANGLMSPIHDRMPVILRRGDWRSWIDADCRDLRHLQSLLSPAQEDALERREVGPYVNNARHEGVECINRVA